MGGMALWLLSVVLFAPPVEGGRDAKQGGVTAEDSQDAATQEVEPPVLLESADAERPGVQPDQTVAVLLLLEIDETGRVVRVELLESGGTDFDAAAIAVAQTFVFEPAREAGIPIAVEVAYRYEFPPVQPDPVEPEPEPPEPSLVDESEVVQAIRIERPVAAARLDRATAEQTPGAQGDVGRALETLGGVAQPSFTGGELVIWGAAPTDTRTYVDWVPIPRLFHLGGARTNLPGAMVAGAELVPAGIGAAWGRAIGGNVRLETRPARKASEAHAVGGYGRVDPIDLSAGMDARLGERGWLGVGLRRSVLRQTYGQLLPTASRELVPLPDTWDYQVSAKLELDARDTLSFLVFGVHDSLVRSIPSLTPDQSFSEEQVAGFHRVGVGLTRQRESGSSLRVSAWLGLDHDTLDQRFADAQALAASVTWAGGLRIDERRRVTRFLVIAAGLDLEYRHTQTTREGALSLPAREGDLVVFGQHPGDRVARDRWGIHQAGLGGYLTMIVGPRGGNWTIEPGLRIEPMISVGDRVQPVRPIEPEVGYNEVEVGVDPRLSARWSVLEALELFAAGGRYHQMPAASELSPVFGNPRLRALEAVHALAGMGVKPTRWLGVELKGFWIASQHLPVRTAEPTPALATVVVSEGRGRNFGGQLTARAQPGHGLLFSLAYTLQRAERAGVVEPSSANAARSWRLFDGDQTHVLQALGAWSHRSGVELGARVSLSSGNPRTPVEGAVFDAIGGRYDPIFAAQNSIRLPTFFELSVRLGWSHDWAWGRLRTWLDIRNVSNRANASELFYNSDFSAQGRVSGLPILPVLGLEIQR